MKTQKSKIIYYEQPGWHAQGITYRSIQQHLRELRRERIKTFLKYLIFSIMGAIAIGIIYICLTSGNDTQKMNECLQDHSLNYCNKVVK